MRISLLAYSRAQALHAQAPHVSKCHVPEHETGAACTAPLLYGNDSCHERAQVAQSLQANTQPPTACSNTTQSCHDTNQGAGEYVGAAVAQQLATAAAHLLSELQMKVLAMLASISCQWRCIRRGPLPKAWIVAQPVMISVTDVNTGERDTASRRLTWRSVACVADHSYTFVNKLSRLPRAVAHEQHCWCFSPGSTDTAARRRAAGGGAENMAGGQQVSDTTVCTVASHPP